MVSKSSVSLLFVANLLIPIAILVFARGFFPYKPFLSGLARYEDLDYGPPPNAPFDKVVFMVVDALRSDFVYSNISGFKFTQSLISAGAALPFTAHATSPTITMPRIKAITTGSTPSFLDLILNFAESDTSSSLATQDTWLAQMKAKQSGKTIMYGDDTWLKLFPQTFDRFDGTSSFFVSDFTEVDNNVTRHIADELSHDDWSTMVLHYLGLDHIGHKTGPRGPNMIPKQKEMDGIIRQIYEAIEQRDYFKSTLLVLCGDHGMNDAGNHGGSAPGETSPALLFISPKLKDISSGLESPAPYQADFKYYSTVEQSDIAPTLGALLGFPVPRNNLGALIPEFLPFWPNNSDKTQILLRNAEQILNVVSATFPNFKGDGPSEKCQELASSVEELACYWRDIKNRRPRFEDGDQNIEAWHLSTQIWLKLAQEIMSGTASNYDVPKLLTGQTVAAFAMLFALLAAWRSTTDSFKGALPLLAITILYGIMMFASSYVEEEHHFWYWTATAYMALLCLQSTYRLRSPFMILTSFAILSILRITRRWNQTGQKLAGEPDISKTFFEHKVIFWAIISITFLWNLQSISSRGFPRFPKLLAGSIGAALSTTAVTFKLAFTNEDSPELMLIANPVTNDAQPSVSLITRARIAFGGIAMVLVYTVATGFIRPRRSEVTMRTIHDLLVLFLIVQTRATNIPLLLISECLFYLINDLELSLVEITTTSLLLKYMSFFAFGGSNAISSIDLSSAYNGISGFNVVAVGVLTFVSNWAGPIYWTSATNIMLLRLRRQGQKDVLYKHLALLTVFVTSSLFSVMAACTILRVHLFIWTVFSPKYLYSMAWSLGYHLCANVGFGSFLYWLGTRYQ